jgi:hypothetical protein
MENRIVSVEIVMSRFESSVKNFPWSVGSPALKENAEFCESRILKLDHLCDVQWLSPFIAEAGSLLFYTGAGPSVGPTAPALTPPPPPYTGYRCSFIGLWCLIDRNNVQCKSQELLLVYADWFVGYILLFTVHQLSLDLQLHELFLAVVVL